MLTIAISGSGIQGDFFFFSFPFSNFSSVNVGSLYHKKGNKNKKTQRTIAMKCHTKRQKHRTEMSSHGVFH